MLEEGGCGGGGGQRGIDQVLVPRMRSDPVLAILGLQLPLEGGRKEALIPFPFPWTSPLHWRNGEATEEQRHTPKCRETNLEAIPKHGHKKKCRNKDIEAQRDTLAMRKSKAKGRWLKDTSNKTGDQRSRIIPYSAL